MKKLLFFTINYPYGKHEPFITLQLKYLSERFSEILLLPFSDSPDGSRPVPQNVRVLPPVRRSSRLVFYVKQWLVLRTWQLFLAETPRQLIQHCFSSKAVYQMARLAAQRSALETCPQIAEALKSQSTLVFYSFWGTPGGYLAPVLSENAIPCCVGYHGFDLFDRGDCLPWRGEVAKASSAVIFATDIARRYFERRVPLEPPVAARLQVYQLGVEAVPPYSGPRSCARLVIASCSGIYPLKRVHLIARIAKALANQTAVEWHHFGGGHDSKLCAELSQRPPNLTVHLHGHTPNEAVTAFYSAHQVDLFINMSTSEGSPVSIMEAMAAGIPAVATAVGGTPELVIDGISGFQVPEDQAEDHERTASRIIAERQPGGLLARSVPHAHWADRYNAAKNYAALADMLAELGALPPPP